MAAFWVGVGILLMVFELLVPLSFAAVVLGASCVELGLLLWLGLPEALAYAVACGSCAVGFLALKRFRSKGGCVAEEDFVGQLVEVLEVQGGGRVRVSWRGTEWDGFVVVEDYKVGDCLEIEAVSDGGTLRLIKRSS